MHKIVSQLILLENALENHYADFSKDVNKITNSPSESASVLIFHVAPIYLILFR